MLILVDRPLTEDLAELHLFGVSIGILGTLALVISLVGGHWVSARMVRPLAVIAETAREISAAQLHRRIEPQLLDRELVPLASVLNSAFARLEQSFRRLSQFTADASHELRTPLAVIQSQAELALLQPRSPDEYRSTLETCLKSADRMRKSHR
jgi:signal transduction histidine kinase